MTKTKTPEKEKRFVVEMSLNVVRADNGKVLSEMPAFRYPNCTRADTVVVQDAFVAMLRQLVDLGYASIEAKCGKEMAAVAHVSRAIIRGEQK